MKLTLLTLSAVLLLSLSCTKQSDSAKNNVSLKLNETMDAPMNGPNGCYHTFIETLNNPPEGYIPGSAYIDLDNCLEPYTHGGSTGGGSHWPPPTPAPADTTRIPKSDNSNDEVFKQFWNWYETPAAEISQKAALYHAIIAKAFAENGGIPELNINRIYVALYYLGNHKDLYPTVDIEHFTKYLNFFYAYESLALTTDFVRFSVSWGPQAQTDFLDSGGIIAILLNWPPSGPFGK